MMADLSRCSAEASRFEALSAPARTGAREHAIASSSKSEHGRAHAPDKLCFRYTYELHCKCTQRGSCIGRMFESMHFSGSIVKRSLRIVDVL